MFRQLDDLSEFVWELREMVKYGFHIVTCSASLAFGHSKIDNAVKDCDFYDRYRGWNGAAVHIVLETCARRDYCATHKAFVRKISAPIVSRSLIICNVP